MSSSARVLAVDLGATSIRVALVDLAEPSPQVEVLHRWRHAPVESPDGTLRWDWEGITREVERGLGLGMQGDPIASIGVDGWGVDYGLIDERGELIAAPFAYRDSRTGDWEQVADRLGISSLYATTGIQLMGINTIFQLAVHDPRELERADRLLLLPDLLVHGLGGTQGAERSNASTTGLMEARSGDWSDELIGELSLRRSLFPEVKQAGVRAGEWRGVPLHLVGSHDTASAFLGMPGSSPNTVFVSTGSWVIVGVERPTPDTSDEARAANFSNEAGALGGFRFLKNVVGLWILERCRSTWGNPPMAALIEEGAAVTEPVPTFDASDHRFLNPDDMEAEVRAAAGLSAGVSRGMVVRVVLESIVAGIADVIEELSAVTGAPMSRVSVVGGGTRLDLLHELLARRTGLEVVTGSPEATALGNAVVQGLALGHFADAGQARDWVDAKREKV